MGASFSVVCLVVVGMLCLKNVVLSLTLCVLSITYFAPLKSTSRFDSIA